jgi:hypothetical protein
MGWQVVGHHIATLAVLADPLLEPRHRVYTSGRPHSLKRKR